MPEMLKESSQGYFPRIISQDQAKDTGMAMVLICLLTAYFGAYVLALEIAMLLLILNMVVPGIYRFMARIWFGIANVLGTVMSKVLLSILFFVMVTPVGMLRRMAGADPLQLRKWKNGDGSVFVVRDHLYAPDEIEKPY